LTSIQPFVHKEKATAEITLLVFVNGHLALKKKKNDVFVSAINDVEKKGGVDCVHESPDKGRTSDFILSFLSSHLCTFLFSNHNF